MEPWRRELDEVEEEEAGCEEEELRRKMESRANTTNGPFASFSCVVMGFGTLRTPTVDSPPPPRRFPALSFSSFSLFSPAFLVHFVLRKKKYYSSKSTQATSRPRELLQLDLPSG